MMGDFWGGPNGFPFFDASATPKKLSMARSCSEGESNWGTQFSLNQSFEGKLFCQEDSGTRPRSSSSLARVAS